MGSRGAGSGAIKAVEVKGNGVTMKYESRGGKLYGYDADGIPYEVPAGITLDQIMSNAKKNGYTVNKLTAKDLAKQKAENKAYKKEMNDFLNQAYVQDKIMKKGSKTSRIGSRIRKKKR